jgi:hypothetical protein
MEPRQITVFFYGLFMDVDLLLSKGVHPMHPRHARVPGFALRIGRRATLIPNAESFAYGIILELSHADIEQLYSDASVREYRPEAVLAQLADGSYSPALCFNLVVPPSQDEANSEYVMKLRELARRLKLPPGYIERIR